MPARNLFSSAFGGLPQVFFGRKNELAFAQVALDNDNSPHRAFFITGNGGCGKTPRFWRGIRASSGTGIDSSAEWEMVARRWKHLGHLDTIPNLTSKRTGCPVTCDSH